LAKKIKQRGYTAMIIFELVNFEGGYQVEAQDVRETLYATSKTGARWIEWSPAMIGIVDKPDVSIVSSRNMFPKRLRKIIETCKGTTKVTYGPNFLGLSYFSIDKGFCVKELQNHLHINADPDMDIDEISDNTSFRQDIWMRTIPMPLPLGR
jgi:hypothetical protein